MKKILLMVGLMSMFLLGTAKADENISVISVPNPLTELVNWVQEQNVGLTACYDIDKSEYYLGAKWQFVQSKHQWLFAGLSATARPSLGFYGSFNLGKLVEKIKGEPLVYLKHLEVGYYGNWDLPDGEYRDGLLLNVIKIEF